MPRVNFEIGGEVGSPCFVLWLGRDHVTRRARLEIGARFWPGARLRLWRVF